MSASEARRTLAGELRAARSMAGISGRAMAKQLGLTQGTVWRIDNGETLPKRMHVEAWLMACGVDVETRDRVLNLLGVAHREAPSWSRRLADASHLQAQAAERERGSRLVRNFQPTLLPGLLQTPDYANAAMSLADLTGDVDLPRALAARLERQAILHEEGRRFEFVIAESAVRWAPKPGVLAGQLDRLLVLAGLASVDLAILPATAASGAVPWHNFVLHVPTDDRSPYVTIELSHEQVQVRDGADVGIYQVLWERLHDAAATGGAAVDVIRTAMADAR